MLFKWCLQLIINCRLWVYGEHQLTHVRFYPIALSHFLQGRSGRGRAGILSRRNDERKMNWEELGRLTRKSIVVREEMKARGCWQGESRRINGMDVLTRLKNLGQIWRLKSEDGMSDWKAKQILMIRLQIWLQLDWSRGKRLWDEKV